MKKTIVCLVFLALLAGLVQPVAGEDTLVITPDFIFKVGDYYIGFTDNVTVTSVVWLPNNWIRFNDLVMRNTKPETLEIKFTGGNITVNKYYEDNILLAGTLYFNESVMEIVIKTRVMPSSLYVKGKYIYRVSSWYTYQESKSSTYWVDIYNHVIYIKLYRGEFTGASLATLFPIEQTEGVSFTIYAASLSGEIEQPQPNLTPLYIATTLVILALVVLALARKHRVQINNLLKRLVYEVKE